MNDGSRSGQSTKDLVFVGDVHLDRGDAALDSFLGFLKELGRSAARLVFLGDLFNLWIGRRELEQPHQRAVAEQLHELRQGGMVVRYVEGNRDYRIAPVHVGSALDEATLDGVTEQFGGHRIRAVHGDLANPSDHSYRRWRRFSRSRLLWTLFNWLPRGRRLRLAESLERRLRASNTEFKKRFPEEEVRHYGTGFLAAGFDTVVLGHFHIEKELVSRVGDPPGRIFVLPEWRESRRHLRVTASGIVEFVDSP